MINQQQQPAIQQQSTLDQQRQYPSTIGQHRQNYPGMTDQQQLQQQFAPNQQHQYPTMIAQQHPSATNQQHPNMMLHQQPNQQQQTTFSPATQPPNQDHIQNSLMGQPLTPDSNMSTQSLNQYPGPPLSGYDNMKGMFEDGNLVPRNNPTGNNYDNPFMEHQNRRLEEMRRNNQPIK